MNKIIWLLILFLLPCSLSLKAEDVNVWEITGIVKNSKNKKVLENVSVSLNGTNIGTVTNAEGFFSLKVPSDKIANGIKAELIGFQSITLPLPKNENDLKNIFINLSPSGKVLKEVLVLGGDPRELVTEALRKIPKNYSEEDNLFQAFYRETVKKGNRFISISEAMVDVLKKPYRIRNNNGERIGIHRGRTLLSPRPSDTLSVKLMGGPYMPIMLDAVKNEDHLFTIDEIEYFEFEMLPAATIENRPHYAISFTPRVSLSYPLNKGTLFIDAESLAISRAEFQLEMKDKSKVTQSILQKKPSGLKFQPQEVSGIVTYKTINGKSYINYISSTMRFKCDWKKRLFSSGYTSKAEMVMVDREENPGENLKIEDPFTKRKIFSDIVNNYWEEDYWKDYNIIEPTESLEKAVEKLKKSK